MRINPFELHINDPDFHDEIYAGSSRRREKYGWFVKGFDALSSTLMTVQHDTHRARRDALSPFFSKRSVMQLEFMIRAKVDRLCDRIEDYLNSEQPINPSNAYTALVMDVICEYCLGKSYGYLDLGP